MEVSSRDCGALSFVTVSLVQLDEFVAEGSVCDTFDICFPEECHPCHWRTRELRKWVEVHIVDGRGDRIRDDSCNARRQQKCHDSSFHSLSC